MITGKLYDYLKWIAQVFLPALGTLYVALAALWGLPAAEAVAGTILAVDLFLGTLLGISQVAYAKSDARFDGTMEIQNRGDTKTFQMAFNDDSQLENVVEGEKKEVLFKVTHE